jgi:two-component system response regulator GlrR
MCKKTLPGFRFIKTAITANSDLLIFLKIALFFGQGRDKMNKIMVVDDDQTILKVIRSNLEHHDFQVLTAMDPKNALDKMNGEAFDLALVDLMLNGESGLDLMENLHRLNPEMPIIILTGYGTIESAVEAMKKGAHSYLTKPFEFRELFYQIKNCLEQSRLSKEVKRLKHIVAETYGFENIIAKSEKMKQVLKQVSKAAESNSLVFINGESGTGKELIAKNLHLASARKKGPFVAVNCAAIPETLVESELFGYEKGAFTGADQYKKGLFTKAHGGTFFLDEISEMSLNMQAKLLRVLEEKTIYPLGGNKPIKVDARILAASNRNIQEEVEKGRFREDLFYRIHVIAINLPPLRERREDIPLLARFFLEKHTRKMQKKITGLSQSASQKLLRHDWPGNVRELENALESAVAMAVENIITDDLILPTRPTESIELKSLSTAKRDFEKDYLIQLIQLTQGNVTKAAKLAGKYRADLYELLKKYKLDPADFRQK